MVLMAQAATFSLFFVRSRKKDFDIAFIERQRPFRSAKRAAVMMLLNGKKVLSIVRANVFSFLRDE